MPSPAPQAERGTYVELFRGLTPQSLCRRLLRRLKEGHTLNSFGAHAPGPMPSPAPQAERGTYDELFRGLTPQALCRRLLRRLNEGHTLNSFGGSRPRLYAVACSAG